MRQRREVPRLFVRSRRLALLVGICLSLLVVNQPPTAAQTDDATPLPLYALPDPNQNPVYSSRTLALAEDGQTLVTANPINHSITLLIPARSLVLTEIPVGRDPRSVAFTPDGNFIVTANRADNTLTVVDFAGQTVAATIPLGGISPYGVVADEGNLAYVSLQHSDEIALVDLARRAVVERIPTPPMPSGLALWGDFLYVTHFWSGDLSLIYLPERRVVRTIRTGLDTALAQSIEIDPSRGLAYLPQSRSNSQNPALTFDTTVFPVVNAVDLRNLMILPQSRLALDVLDQPVNMPFAAALDRFSTRVYIANAGTNDVTVLDTGDGQVRGHVDVGANPRGLLLNFNGSLLFVHNVLDGTITIIDTSDLSIIDELPISDLAISNDLFIGAQLFYTADDPRISASGWVSCANCHFDGMSDGRAWAGFPGGARNTPVLYGLTETLPYTWTGGWDELADVEVKIRDLHAGAGLLDQPLNPPLGEPHSGLSADLDALVSYMLSLQAPQTPPNGDPALIERGAQVFAGQNCAECHVGGVGTNLQAFAVGTGETAEAVFDTPSLRWLWLSAPYFHDGSAATLSEVFALPGAHQLTFDVAPQDIEALVAYLLAQPPAIVP
jgi:YVTN family beta-propeller protein